MRNKLEIFKKAQELLDEPEVQELLDYCEQIEDELVDLKFDKEKSKEVIKGCNAIEKEQMEHERFGYEAPNYQATISNLKRYILGQCRDNKIYL